MRILFLNLSPLHANAGHLARFKLELDFFEKEHQLHIINLSSTPDTLETHGRYPNVFFSHIPIIFDGWEIQNINYITEQIIQSTMQNCIDLVILQVEIWDLMRELTYKLKNIGVRFATIVHAMPFLGSPLNPTGDFKKDVLTYVNSDISQYRKDYILKHYTEAELVFKDLLLIANNNTVHHYLNLYFNNLKIFLLTRAIISNTIEESACANLIYDFVYMARMEKGKGVNYLFDILSASATLLSRKVSLLIAGRQDDTYARKELKELLEKTAKNNIIDITYIGWADDKTKAEILPKCGVFIYPSIYDNYPTVISEALSFGLPSIVWNVPFYYLNYLENKAVIAIEHFSTIEFAKSSVYALKNRKKLAILAKKNIQSSISAHGMYLSDIQIFKRITSTEND